MVKLSDVQDAQKVLKGIINETPLDYSEKYSNITGGNIFLKLENLQRTGSVKVRGAYSKIASIKKKGAKVTTASAGNQAQGVAFAAAKCGKKATIVMPVVTPVEKVEATRNYGAEVVLEGKDFDEACDVAKEINEKNKGAYISSYDDPKVIAGHGTVALEILEKAPDMQAIVVPVGAGGLISGIAVAAKSINPDIKIIGVQSSGSAAMKTSIDTKKLHMLEYANTIADGVAVRHVCKRTFDLTKKYVDEIVLVDDEEIASVIIMMLERSKLLVEGAGAMALTAALYGKVSLHGLKTALVVSGGNIAISTLAKIMERGLVKSGRLVHICIDLPDAPGVLSLLTGIIGDFGINILNIEHGRNTFDLPFRKTKIDFKLEVKGFDEVNALLKELRSRGYEVEITAK